MQELLTDADDDCELHASIFPNLITNFRNVPDSSHLTDA